MSEKLTNEVADETANWPWYVSSSDEMWTEEASRDAAIEVGREQTPPGSYFQIAQGGPRGPWPNLFDTVDDLAEYIDDHNEDNSFEDGFTTEAALTNADLEPLLAAINAAWTTFLDTHKPTSNALDLVRGERFDVPLLAGGR